MLSVHWFVKACTVLLAAFIAVSVFGRTASAEGLVGPTSGGAVTPSITGMSVGLSADTVYVASLDTLIIERRLRDANATTELRAKSGGGDRRATYRHASTSSDPIPLGGFVMNETFSVIGNDFYSAFYSVWSEPEGVSMYTVRVREEPAPRFGAQIIVEVDDTQLFRAFLRPNNGRIRKAAKSAVGRVTMYLKKYHKPRTVY